MLSCPTTAKMEKYMAQCEVLANQKMCRSRVLVVDDEPVHCLLVREILESSEFEVYEAGSGPEAVDMLRRMAVDAVLLDKNLPGFDGDEVCRHIRQELGLARLPILMITGDNGVDSCTVSLAAGANDILRKPYDPNELLARIRLWLHAPN